MPNLSVSQFPTLYLCPIIVIRYEQEKWILSKKDNKESHLNRVIETIANK